MNLGELLKIVLKKGNFLFLRCAAPSVIRVHLCTLYQAGRRGLNTLHLTNFSRSNRHFLSGGFYFFHSGSQVLDKKLPQVVQSLQLFGLKSQEENKGGEQTESVPARVEQS